MKSYLIKLLPSLFIAVFSLNCFSYSEINRVVALVQNSPITVQDLKDFSVKYNLTLNEKDIEKAFDELVNMKVMQIQAKLRNIEVSDQILDQQIVNIAQRNNLSIKQFYDQIQGNYPGGFEIYREDIRLAILKEQIKQRIIIPRMDGNSSQENLDIQTVISTDEKEREIVIQKIEVSDDNNLKYSKIQEAYEKLQLGIDFTEVAKVYSEESLESRGEIIGWIKQNNLDDSIKQAFEGLKSHEYTRPKKIDESWYIFKLIDSKLTPKKSTEDNQIENNNKLVDEEFNLWLNESKSFLYIEIKEDSLDKFIKQNR